MQSALQSLGNTRDGNDALVKSRNIHRQEKIQVKSGLKATLAFCVLVVYSLTCVACSPELVTCPAWCSEC